MLATRRLTSSLLFIAAAALMMAAATPGDPIAIGTAFNRADNKLFRLSSNFANSIPSTVTATLRKLEKADAKGKSIEQLTAIAATANAKLQLKSDKCLVKLYDINDDAVITLTELEAELDYMLALSYAFAEYTTNVSQGTQDAIDQINQALADEIAD